MLAAAVAFCCASKVSAGPYTDPGIPSAIADPANPGGTIPNPAFRTWAGQVVSYTPAPGINAANGNPARALGPATTTTLSLGDLSAEQIAGGDLPGQIVLRMEQPLYNGPGWDLAVFENGFPFFPPDDDKLSTDLSYVDVSTDGATFARFPSISLTTEATLFTLFGRDFAGIDPTDVYNLAGKHPARTGTPFDLAELAADPAVTSGAVDLSDIRYVRIVDIPGSGDFVDSQGNGILDPWVTTDLTHGNGGFDLDAVGGRYAVPEPSSLSFSAAAVAVLIAAARRRLWVRRRGNL